MVTNVATLPTPMPARKAEALRRTAILAQLTVCVAASERCGPLDGNGPKDGRPSCPPDAVSELCGPLDDNGRKDGRPSCPPDAVSELCGPLDGNGPKDGRPSCPPDAVSELCGPLDDNGRKDGRPSCPSDAVGARSPRRNPLMLNIACRRAVL